MTLTSLPYVMILAFCTMPTALFAQVFSLDSDAGQSQWVISKSNQVQPTADWETLQAGDALPTEGWQSVNVPDNLNDAGIEVAVTDSIWYRTEFHLDAVPEHPMSVRLGEISDRDRTYLNGQLIGATGEFGAQQPQAYDRVRIYTFDPQLLRVGTNVLHIEVQPYFTEELGIYRDRTAMGPATQLLRRYYLENLGESLTLMAYFTLGIYFLLFYLRRRQGLENLFFALFLFCLVIYSFFRTQLKYELGLELFPTKRLQTLAVIAAFPLFYSFVRYYYQLPEKIVRILDWISYAAHLIPLSCMAVILISDSTRTWQNTLNTVVQPSWIIYVLGVFFILIYAASKKNRDAIVMLISSGILLVALVLDILTGRAIINLPTLLTYAFTLMVLSMALILANRFVRLHNETEQLNRQLSRFNTASMRFVPMEFLRILKKESIVDVELGNQVQKEMCVLFSDIRSFTTLSESMTPPENFAFINSYLRRMGPVIRKHGGFIDKYIGDAIMALFDGGVSSGVDASVDMMRTLHTWNAGRGKYGYDPVTIGIGLHAGPLMLGTIGENERMEGTVISDAVNLAARVEGLTKKYGTAILITDAIQQTIAADGKYQT
ncbi:MAG: adenylate/guanylate cyclase domain-containing protein, partial [Leptospiraceae bacterium]|nr:adenylate/guanylate cyclase domain-containing protein [Leptospiraceae bacterium]